MIYDTSKTISSKQWGEIAYDGTFLLLSKVTVYDTLMIHQNFVKKTKWENYLEKMQLKASLI